ncbi:MAG: YncE family protein [Candidatus Eisenbacteria bacterium]|nr:YncE family protein [Candidatus Eisenbacteria bacterium]
MRHRSLRNAALLLPLALTVFAASRDSESSASPAPYHVVARWNVGGEGGWDALTADASARRLYITHGTRVEVLDLDSGALLGAIAETPGAHEVALAPELNRGFVSCGRDSSVAVFDLKTLASLARIAVPARNPDAIVYEPTTRRVFAFNGGSGNVCAFDATTGAFVGTLDLGGRPEFALHDGHGRVYVNLEDRSEIVAFDSRTLNIGQRWPLAPGEEPTGLAIDRAHHRLFAGCSNHKLMVLDAKDGKMLATLPIREGVDGVRFDARQHLVFSSNGDGTLSVAGEHSHGGFEVIETDSTQRGARTLALDERTGRVFVATARFGPPPEPTADRPHPRPSIVPGSFVVLVLSR